MQSSKFCDLWGFMLKCGKVCLLFILRGVQNLQCYYRTFFLFYDIVEIFFTLFKTFYFLIIFVFKVLSITFLPKK